MRVLAAALRLVLRRALQLAVVDSVGVVPRAGAGERPVHLVHAVLLVVAVGVDRVRVVVAGVLGEHDRFDVLEIAEAEILARTLRVHRTVDNAVAETVNREISSVRQFHVV